MFDIEYLTIVLITLTFLIFYVLNYFRFRRLEAWIAVLSSRFIEKKDLIDVPMDEESALKICAMYHNGDTYENIMKEFGFSSPIQVKRNIIKGLGILLKEHSGKVKP